MSVSTLRSQQLQDSILHEVVDVDLLDQWLKKHDASVCLYGRSTDPKVTETGWRHISLQVNHPSEDYGSGEVGSDFEFVVKTNDAKDTRPFLKIYGSLFILKSQKIVMWIVDPMDNTCILSEGAFRKLAQQTDDKSATLSGIHVTAEKAEIIVERLTLDKYFNLPGLYFVDWLPPPDKEGKRECPAFTLDMRKKNREEKCAKLAEELSEYLTIELAEELAKEILPVDEV